MMRRVVAFIAALLMIWSPARAFAEEPLAWRADPDAANVENVKTGTEWGRVSVTGYVDERFGYNTTLQSGRIYDYAGGDAYDSLLAGTGGSLWILRPLESPSQPGTYTTVSDWTAEIYRGDATDKSLRVFPSVMFMIERRNAPAATETLTWQTMSIDGYWPDQAAPKYSLDATSKTTLDYRYTNDTVPTDQLTDSDGDLEPVLSRGTMLVSYRPRAGANVWDVYVGLWAHISGSSATDYRAVASSFTVNASTAATAYAPFDQTNIYIALPAAVRLCDPAGIPPSYEPATLVQGDAFANLKRENYYSASTAASDRVADYIDEVDGEAWPNMEGSGVPTTTVPATQSVPASQTTPSVPTTVTPGADWYALITNAVAPLKGLLWPLDFFGKLAGR